MYTHFTNHLAQEHAALTRVREEREALQRELGKARSENETLRERLDKELRDARARAGSLEEEKADMIRRLAGNVRLEWECEQLRREVQRLRSAASDETAQGMQQRESIRMELADQMETRIGSRECHSPLSFSTYTDLCIQKVLAETHEQKLKRLEAERKLAEVQQQLRAVSFFSCLTRQLCIRGIHVSSPLDREFGCRTISSSDSRHFTIDECESP
jgi:chromosome segregation ATPase